MPTLRGRSTESKPGMRGPRANEEEMNVPTRRDQEGAALEIGYMFSACRPHNASWPIGAIEEN